MHTAGASCLARTLRRWATKPNMRKKFSKLEFSFWFDHVIHVPFWEWYRKSQMNTLTCLESMLGLVILKFSSPLLSHNTQSNKLSKFKLKTYFAKTKPVCFVCWTCGALLDVPIKMYSPGGIQQVPHIEFQSNLYWNILKFIPILDQHFQSPGAEE